MDYNEFKRKYHIRLDAQQEKAVQAIDGPVLLLAVPGSGKTTVLVTRIGYMCYVQGIKPENILTMTYTVAAAKDMRRRYASFFGEEVGARLEFRTINGVCSRILSFYERTLGRTAFKLLSDGGQQSAMVAELCRAQTNDYVAEGTVKSVQTAITYVKNQMLTKAEIEKVEVEGVDFPPIYFKYCKQLRDQKLMDYDDQMVYALQVLRQYPQILRAVQNQYQYFCVDEAQDTSKIQHHIIRLLSSRSKNLFMVGDEDQSIYGFRAAYPQALTEFEMVYPNAKVLYMEQNYRSTKQIVALADRFIQKNKNRHPKHMKATKGDGPTPREVNLIDRQKQYAYLCKVAENCTVETAVLYRDNDSVLPLIDRLDRSHIPYRCRQVDSLFFSNRIVRDVCDIIRLAMDPGDGERFMRIYYKLGAGISRKLAQEAVSWSGRTGKGILEFISAHTTASPWTKKQCRALQTHMQNMLHEQADKAVYRIAHYMGYGEYLEEHGIDQNKLQILEALGVEQATPKKLLKRLDELQKVVQAGSTGGSTCPFILSTIHSSKGLEYRRVFLMDVVDGILPKEVPQAKASEEEWESYEEERRLFYVGMTRAKDELSVFTFKRSDQKSDFSMELFPRQEEKTAKPHPKHTTVSARPKAGMTQIQDLSKDYIPGTLVEHKIFGRGRLTSRAGDIVTIAFSNGEDKRFSISTAIRMGQLKLHI